jgi:predicted dehydrogenase
MSNLRIGVVGMGNRAGLARAAQEPEMGADVVLAADITERGRDRAKELFGADIATTADYREMFDAGLDAVILTTPDFAHEDEAVEFLKAGVSVYVEKPLAITIEGCDRVLAAAQESGTRLYVGHNMRHMPVVLQMRELITSGAIGEVKAVWCRHFVGNGGEFYYKTWHADRTKSTSLLLQKGAHDIDVIHWLAGGYTRRVSAMGALTVYGDIKDRRDNSDRLMKDWLSYNWPPSTLRDLNPVVDVEDLSMLTMALDNGVYATYEQCHFTPDYWRNYTVIGTEGRIENFGDMGEGVIRLWNKRTDYNPDGDKSFPIQTAQGGHGGADSAIMAEFLRFVRDGGVTNTSPVAAREAVATGVTATVSLRSDSSALPVPALPADLVSYFESGQQSR